MAFLLSFFPYLYSHFYISFLSLWSFFFLSYLDAGCGNYWNVSLSTGGASVAELAARWPTASSCDCRPVATGSQFRLWTVIDKNWSMMSVFDAVKVISGSCRCESGNAGTVRENQWKIKRIWGSIQIKSIDQLIKNPIRNNEKDLIVSILD